MPDNPDPLENPESEKTDDSPESLSIFSGEPDEDGEDFWSGDDLEQAYREAVNTLDHVEQEYAQSLPDANDEDDGDVQSLNDFPGVDQPVAETEDASASDVPPVPRLKPQRILEAALFVGGEPLTVKRLGMLLRDEFDRDFIERSIDDLNLQYDDENRPYEIRLEEGGYRLVLRSEFESVRNKSYGFGPKEVRLSQDVLEVLAMVAYHQPITREDIEKAGKSNANGALRQLLRREIIGLERTGKKAKDVTYHTTPRFLQIFGLADLSELPRSEDLQFK